jgi:hypothetical protein
MDFERARQFVYTEARLIDRLAFAATFDGGEPKAVIAALTAYQNADGGFGHALEPDTRTPTSQPLYVETALQYMADAGATIDYPMVCRACDFLAAVSSPQGGAPILLPSYRSFAHAEHWRTTDLQPGINPNGGIAGLLRQLDVEHPCIEPLERFCWTALERLKNAHDVSEALIFLANVQDRIRAEPIAERLVAALPGMPFFKADPAARGYGLDALHFAPAPDSSCRQFFDDTQIESALDHLIAEQQPDGGWPITWNSPGNAAHSEWRAIRTLKALRRLKAYDRL